MPISFLLTRFSLKVAAVFCAGAILGILAVLFAPMQVDVQMRTKEKGFLQCFVDTGAGFNEAQSKRTELSESPDFSHYEVSIRAWGVRTIRIDPFETKGQFEIRALKIGYPFWYRQWFGHDELAHLISPHGIELKSTEGPLLSGQATDNDPSFVVANLKYLEPWPRIAMIIGALGGGISTCFLMLVLRYFGGLKNILAKKHTLLVLIVVIAAILRFVYWGLSGLPAEPGQLGKIWFDEGTYFSLAQYIMNHGLTGYLFAEESVMTTPANPVYHALVYTVFNSVNAIRMINLFFSLWTIILVYKLGQKTFNTPVGLVAAAICAVHGQFIQYSATLLTEPLFFCFFLGGLYYLALAVEAQKLPRSRYQRCALAAALFLTIAILTRSIAMLLPLLLLAGIGSLEAYRSWWGGKPSFPWLKHAALPLLLPVLIVAILAAKNYVVFDRFMLATGSGAALWLGSRADTEGDEPHYRGRTYDTEVITHGLSHLSIQGDKLLLAAAKDNIRENPINYAWWSVKKFGRLVVGNNLAWFYPHKNITELYHASGKDLLFTAKMLFQILLAAIIAVYGIIGFVTARGQELFRIITCLSACYLLIFSVPFLAIQRYGLPVVWLLVIPASAVIHGAWNNTGRLRRAALFGLPFVAAIVFQAFL